MKQKQKTQTKLTEEKSTLNENDLGKAVPACYSMHIRRAAILNPVFQIRWMKTHN